MDPRSHELYAAGYRDLADGFDAAISMVRVPQEEGDFHCPRRSLAYALCLLRDGQAEEMAVAEALIGRVLSMQETRPGNAHVGNFRWLYEHDTVADLNAVEFVLEQLSVILLHFRDRLTSALRDWILETIRLGLREIEQLNVHVSYTNIALLDCRNSILCGEILGDRDCIERGRRKLGAWMEHTARSGAPHEFNSPTYCGVDLAALADLVEHSGDAEVALRARLMEERLWLHVATHFHRPTCQLAGPHSRAYRYDTVGAAGLLKVLLYKELGYHEFRRKTPYYPWPSEEHQVEVALGRYHLPDYLRPLFDEKPPVWEVRETADAGAGMDLTSFMTPDYCLGTMSTPYGVGEPPETWPQFNAAILYFRKEGEPGYGVLYTRYTINDMDVRGPGPTRHDVWDLGLPRCGQHRNMAIAVYGLMPLPIIASVHSLKLDVMLLGHDEATEVRVGGEVVTSLPRTVLPGQPVALSAGTVYVGLLPLEPTNMGQEAPIVFEERGGELVLTIHNYRGPSKNFWEYRTLSGPFFKGNVRCELALEVASRKDFPSLEAFAAHMAAAEVVDTISAKNTREVIYKSEGESLSLRYSLSDLRVLERRINGQPYSSPPLEAPLVRQSGGAPIALGAATFDAGGSQALLLADDERQLWVGTKLTGEPASVRLTVPAGSVEIDDFVLGRVAWQMADGRIEVWSSEPLSTVRLVAPEALRILINGVDISQHLRKQEGAARVYEPPSAV